MSDDKVSNGIVVMERVGTMTPSMDLLDRVGLVAQTWRLVCDRREANGKSVPSFEKFLRDNADKEHMYTAKALVVLNDMLKGSMLGLIKMIGTLSDARGFTAESAPALLEEPNLHEYAARLIMCQHLLDVDLCRNEAEARTCHTHQQRLRDLLGLTELPSFEDCGYAYPKGSKDV